MIVRERAPREADRVGGGAQVAGHERQVGRLDRDVGAGADREAEICLRERRRVVDAVADHRDDPPSSCSALDLGAPCRPGSTPATTRSIPTSAATVRRGALVVAGEEHRRQAEPAELANRLGARRLEPVARPRGAPLRSPSQRDGDRVPPRRRAPTVDSMARSDDRRRRRHRPRRRLLGTRAVRSSTAGSAPDRLAPHAATACATGCSDRRLDRAGEAEELVRARPRSAGTASVELHPPLGDGAGLVEHDRRDPAGLLEHLRPLDQDPELRARGRSRPSARSASRGRARTGRR